jgi:hypothetical protein
MGTTGKSTRKEGNIEKSPIFLTCKVYLALSTKLSALSSMLLATLILK